RAHGGTANRGHEEFQVAGLELKLQTRYDPMLRRQGLRPPRIDRRSEVPANLQGTFLRVIRPKRHEKAVCVAIDDGIAPCFDLLLRAREDLVAPPCNRTG